MLQLFFNEIQAKKLLLDHCAPDSLTCASAFGEVLKKFGEQKFIENSGMINKHTKNVQIVFELSVTKYVVISLIDVWQFDEIRCYFLINRKSNST